jgi:hypothetical protein
MNWEHDYKFQAKNYEILLLAPLVWQCVLLRGNFEREEAIRSHTQIRVQHLKQGLHLECAQGNRRLEIRAIYWNEIRRSKTFHFK